MMNFKSIYIATATSGVLTANFEDELTDSINALADKILRDRVYLLDQLRLNKLIEEVLKGVKQ